MEQSLPAAIIFDFDGLILDTETPELRVWQQFFEEAGGEFDLPGYLGIVGTYDYEGYQPGAELAKLTHYTVPEEELTLRVRKESSEIISREGAMQGVVTLIAAAKGRGIRIAIGSSSPSNWVCGHLARLGLLDKFDALVTFDDVSASKPSPEIFLKALTRLGVPADRAIVLEDSQNGVLAANRAGIRVVAVPNLVTQGQDFSGAVEVIPSLEVLDLDKYFPEFAGE
ncbi:MAG: HAD-IA family hydrolase [Anaerolineaceae bacterium]